MVETHHAYATQIRGTEETINDLLLFGFSHSGVDDMNMISLGSAKLYSKEADWEMKIYFFFLIFCFCKLVNSAKSLTTSIFLSIFTDL